MAGPAPPPQSYGWTDADLPEDEDCDGLLATPDGGNGVPAASNGRGRTPDAQLAAGAAGHQAWPGFVARRLLLVGALCGAFALGRHTPRLAAAMARGPASPEPAATTRQPTASAGTKAAAAGSPWATAAASPWATAAGSPLPRPATSPAAAAPPPAPAPAAAAVGEAGLPRLRLVVNSNVRYSLPLEFLLKSLEAVKSPNVTRYFKELLIVVGGSTAEIEPHTAPGRWGELGVTHINVTQNGFDFNGLAALFRYRNHPRANAHAYLYVHDTVLFTKDFAERFDQLASVIGADEVRIPPVPHSNIFAMGHGVVERYKKNFDHNFTKAQGLDVEWNRSRLARDISTFARSVTKVSPRAEKGLADPYHTGIKRSKCLYKDFGLEKFILKFRYGDIGGDGKLRDNDHR